MDIFRARRTNGFEDRQTDVQTVGHVIEDLDETDVLDVEVHSCAHCKGFCLSKHVARNAVHGDAA